MIKLLALFAVAVYAVNAVNGELQRTVIHLPPVAAAQFRRAVPKCTPKNEDVNEMFRIMREGEWREDEEFKTFAYCTLTDTGYIRKDGTILIEKSAAEFPDKNTMTKVFTKCAKEVGKTPVETAHRALICYQKTTPYKVLF